MNWGSFLLDHFWGLIGLGVLLAFSGFFSGTETALFNLTGGQLHRLRRSEHSLQRLVSSLMDRPRHTLNTLLLGNMLVNVAYAGDSAVLVLDLTHTPGVPAWQVGVASLIPLLGLILLGEVTPKMIAYRLGERWAVVAVGPAALAGRILAPVLLVLDKGLVSPLTKILAPRVSAMRDITADELAALLEVSSQRGQLDRDAGAMLQGIVELTHLRVSEIMVPRVDMVAFDVSQDPAGLRELFRRTGLRKIPVYEDDLDNILGVIHAKRLWLHPDRTLRDLTTEVFFVPEMADLEKTLLQFRIRRRQLAIVVDEFGGTAGLVTLEDILEEIVGDLPDTEGQQEGQVVRALGENRYLLDGSLAIHDWVDAFKMDLNIERYNTIGGFVTSLLGRLPQVGDVTRYRNLKFTVDSVRGRRVETLLLELQSPSPGGEKSG